MNAGAIVGVINLFFLGLLAGEEFMIRYGVRAPVASLDDIPHIRLRQALILNLRILVPIIVALATLSGLAVTVLDALDGFDFGFGFRCAGLLALLTFILVTLLGTVPINEAALTWDPTAPPKNWRALVNRWERLDTVRCWAAVAAFAFFLIALAIQ